MSLLEAARRGSIADVERLLAAGADIEAKNKNQDTPLILAAKNGHTVVVELLLAAGADKEAKNMPFADTPLLVAALNGKTAVVERLLAAGANKEAKNMPFQDTPLLVAASKGHIAVIERLLAAGADIEAKNANQDTPLIVAALNGKTAVVDRLLAAGADKEAKDADQETPLLIATRYGYTAIVEHLLAAGANKEAKNKTHDTPLILAALNGHTVVVDHLLAAGADKDAKNANQDTPLILASLNGYTAIVERLLAAGADIEAKNKYQETPLMLAAYNGHIAIVERLLAAGADKDAKNKDGKTAYDIATEKGHMDIVLLLMPKWKGFSRSDIELLNHVFETESKVNKNGVLVRSDAENISVCPICFKVVHKSAVMPTLVSRQSGCMYMLDHNCSTAGGYYHKELYEKYKNPDGTITWCTICGRICQRTPHAHYRLTFANNPRAGVLPHLGDPFGGEADCIKDGGGGLMEKLARYRRMREFALELQDEIGKISFNDAVDALIEETWNAPLNRKLALPKIAKSKKWNISAKEFIELNKANAAANAPNVEWPFRGRPEMMPLITDAAEGNMNVISYNDITTRTIQLRHRKENGELIFHDKISIDTLFGAQGIGQFSAAGTPTFGLCFFGCSAIQYPDELQYILDNYNHESLTKDKYDEYKAKIDMYRKRFNEAYASNAGFKARVDADRVAAAGMAMGGAGAGAGMAGGRRRSRRSRRSHKQKTRKNKPRFL